MPSGAVAEPSKVRTAASARQELWDRLNRAGRRRSRAQAPLGRSTRSSSQALRCRPRPSAPRICPRGGPRRRARGDINGLIERAIFADRALVDLEGALNASAVELRRELQEAVDHEREIQTGLSSPGSPSAARPCSFLLAFAWLYADRHLAGRLVALSRSMLAIAGGDLRTPGCRTATGGDEIAAMAKALSVFRDTAVEIEEQNLRERQVVLDTIEYGVLILDPELRVRMYNRAFRDLWGVPERCCARLSGSMTCSEAFRIERHARRAGRTSGSPMSSVGSPRSEAADVPPTGMASTGRARTAVRGCGPAGRRAHAHLFRPHRTQAGRKPSCGLPRSRPRSASRAKSDFLASMSHELRTPLNAIIGISEMLKEDAEIDGDKHLEEPLGRVLRAGKLLLQLINEVLDLAKIEAGKLELQPEEIDLRRCSTTWSRRQSPWRRSTRTSSGSRRRRSRTGGGRSHASAPDPPQPALERLQVHRAWRGDALTARRDGQQVELRVRDTGIGIDAEQLPRLFQEFHQAGVAKQRKYGGTGLGPRHQPASGHG